MRKVIFVSAVALLLGTGIAAQAKPIVGANLMPQAKVTLAQARATALKAHPGVITDQELEKEAGGTGLRYSFTSRTRARPSRSASTAAPARCSRTRLRVPIPTKV